MNSNVNPQDRLPLTDVRDDEEVQNRQGPLGLVISYIDKSELPGIHSNFSKISTEKQRNHKILSLLAIFFGSVAIFLSILQVFLESISLNIDMDFVRLFVWFFIFLSISVVVISLVIEYIQKNRLNLSYLSIFFGFVAIILAILQVFLGPQSVKINMEFIRLFIRFFELISISIAISAVGVALFYRQHKEWLKKRFLAEQCRSEKFRALIYPSLWYSSESWDSRFALWKKYFDKKVTSLEKLDHDTLEMCLVSDKIDASSYNANLNSIQEADIRSLVDYYQQNRLVRQINYYNDRAEYFDSINWTRWIPDFCFIGSIIFVACHFCIDFGIDFSLLQPNPEFRLLSSVSLMLTLMLPILALSSRTLRSSIEVSRSAALFRAKSNALIAFNNQLGEELSRENIRWDGILKILWECENFFENENREWLRMMHEAEWFI